MNDYLDMLNNYNLYFKNGNYLTLSNVEPTVSVNVNIKDYKVINDKVVIVCFADGTSTKSVCHSGDTFDLERGIEICVMKRILGETIYYSAINDAMKKIKAIDKKKAEAKAEEKIIADKKAKIAKKKSIRDKKRAERERAEKIAIQKEAYLAAMRELNGK